MVEGHVDQSVSEERPLALDDIDGCQNQAVGNVRKASVIAHVRRTQQGGSPDGYFARRSKVSLVLLRPLHQVLGHGNGTVYCTFGNISVTGTFPLAKLIIAFRRVLRIAKFRIVSSSTRTRQSNIYFLPDATTKRWSYQQEKPKYNARDF